MLLHDSRKTTRDREVVTFQWAPTLGGECYKCGADAGDCRHTRFNGHPPLGVNATTGALMPHLPTIASSFNGHPPLGVNATVPVLHGSRIQTAP